MAQYDGNRDLVAAENEMLKAQITEQTMQLQQLLLQLSEKEEQISDLQLHTREHPRDPSESSTSRIDLILKSMQTPQILRDIPSFTGDVVKLNSFIKAIDNIIPAFRQVENTPTYDVWKQAVRGKITGDADAVLQLYGTEINWEEIKSTLITHFGDKRDESSLTKDLLKIKQVGTAEELYGNISYYLSLLINLLNLNEQNPDVRKAKKTFYQELGLKVFLGELMDPPGHIIRAQSPKNLKDALRICLDENNITYGRNTHRPPPIPIKPPQNKYPLLPPKPFVQPMPFPKFPQQPYQQKPPHQLYQPRYQQPPYQQKFLQQPKFPQQRFPQQPKFPQQPYQQKFQNPYQSNFPQQQNPYQPKPYFQNYQFRQQPTNAQNVFAPRPAFQPKPVPMEVDQSIRSRGINYMNRPNFHIEHEPFDYNNYPQYPFDNNYYYYPEQYFENDLAVQPVQPVQNTFKLIRQTRHMSQQQKTRNARRKKMTNKTSTT